MSFEYDQSALKAVLRASSDGWVVAIELATGGSWGHATTTWRETPVSRAEVAAHRGSDDVGGQAVIDFVEFSLRRAGWRAVRGDPVTPPDLEVWDLSPASDYR